MTLVFNTFTNVVSQEFSVATFLTYAHLHPTEPPSPRQPRMRSSTLLRLLSGWSSENGRNRWRPADEVKRRTTGSQSSVTADSGSSLHQAHPSAAPATATRTPLPGPNRRNSSD